MPHLTHNHHRKRGGLWNPTALTPCKRTKLDSPIPAAANPVELELQPSKRPLLLAINGQSAAQENPNILGGTRKVDERPVTTHWRHLPELQEETSVVVKTELHGTSPKELCKERRKLPLEAQKGCGTDERKVPTDGECKQVSVNWALAYSMAFQYLFSKKMHDTTMFPGFTDSFHEPSSNASLKSNQKLPYPLQGSTHMLQYPLQGSGECPIAFLLTQQAGLSIPGVVNPTQAEDWFMSHSASNERNLRV